MLSSLFYIVNFSLLIIVSVVGIIFACLTLTIVIIDRKCHTTTNLFLCNTSVAIICIFILHLIDFAYSLPDNWVNYQPACGFRAYIASMLCAVICYSYSIQALSRLFSVVFYKYKYLQASRVHWLMIIISWLISILTSIVPFFYHNAYGLEQESRMCTNTTKIFFTSLYSVVIDFVIPLNIVTVIYGIIFHYARQSTRRVVTFISNTTKISTLNVKREMKLMKNMSLSLGLLTCGGTPYLILVLWHATQDQPPPEAFYLLSIMSILICSSLNMIALFYMSKDVKNSAVGYLRKLYI
jgi:hypothetical protein